MQACPLHRRVSQNNFRNSNLTVPAINRRLQSRETFCRAPTVERAVLQWARPVRLVSPCFIKNTDTTVGRLLFGQGSHNLREMPHQRQNGGVDDEGEVSSSASKPRFMASIPEVEVDELLSSSSGSDIRFPGGEDNTLPTSSSRNLLSQPDGKSNGLPTSLSRNRSSKRYEERNEWPTPSLRSPPSELGF